MRAHADDLVAVLDHLGLERAVLTGHSMGAYVATTAATAHPTRWSAVVLVDGGVALPLPHGVDPDDMLAGVLGPALARLEMTFADRAAYHAFWREHPALAEPGAWTADTEAWLDHDLIGTEPELRSSASLEAVRFDGRELLVDREVRRAFMDMTPAVGPAASAPRPAQPGAAAAPRRAHRPAARPLADPPRDAGRQHQPLLDPPVASRRQGRRQPPHRRPPDPAEPQPQPPGRLPTDRNGACGLPPVRRRVRRRSGVRLGVSRAGVGLGGAPGGGEEGGGAADAGDERR